MNPITSWSFRPYTELPLCRRGKLPYICRLAPEKGGFTVDFIDNGAAADAQHLVFVRERGKGTFTPVKPVRKENCFTAHIECPDLTDYEVYAERSDGARSAVRLVRTGYVPGTVIHYLHPEDDAYVFSGKYLCSPSLLKLPDGTLLASMDVYEGGSAQNLTLIYRSTDGGKTFEYLTELFPCFWGKLFLAGGKLYMLGVSCEYGDLLIGRSDDGGRSWGMPTVLFRGSGHGHFGGIHRAPMPVEFSHGLLMTDVQYGSWSRGFGDFILSAEENSNLLDPANWKASEMWFPKDSPVTAQEHICGGIEGSVVTAPDGKVYDILRFSTGKLLKLGFDPENREGKLTFEGFIQCPITESKADIVYDKESKRYWMIASYKNDCPATLRNLLSLLYSSDLDTWKLAGHLMDFREDDPDKTGFQYVSFFIDGDDILYQSRTALNGAHSFHDSNYSTFHRIPDFRKLAD